MIDQGKVDVIGIPIDAVDYEAAVRRIIEAATAATPYPVSALAVHGVMTGFDDPEHRDRLRTFGLITPDGQPVRWAMNLLHHTGLRDRVYGPKLTLDVCREAARLDLGVFFYGSTPETLASLEEHLPSLVPGVRITGTRPSLFRPATAAELDDIAAEIRATGARICFVGLGCPRQEVFAYENAPRLSMPTIAVGAAFDYHAGLQEEPPAWIQRFGLQWLHRLIQNPRRLWRRYLILNPRYVWAVTRQRFGRSTAGTEAETGPGQDPPFLGWA